MLKSYVIMPALCSVHKTMHNARYNARLICAGLLNGLAAHRTGGKRNGKRTAMGRKLNGNGTGLPVP